MYTPISSNETRENDAFLAHLNGVWHNTRITPGQIHGPVSGDAITESIAYSASRRAIENAARRPALEIATNFRVKTQSAAYNEGARDAYRLLVTRLEEGGINNLLDGIDCNADSDTRARMNAYYTAKDGN